MEANQGKATLVVNFRILWSVEWGTMPSHVLII